MRSLLLAALLIGAGAFGLAGPALAAAPANLVSNGDFATDVSGWNTSGATTAWDSGDASSDPASGSLKGGNANPYEYDNHGYIEQCLRTPLPGATYDFRGKIRVPPGQTEFIAAYLWMFAYGGPNCSGSDLGNNSSEWLTTVAPWTPAETQMNLAASTRSVKVVLVVARKGVPEGTVPQPVVAYFDDISLSRALLGDYRLVVPSLAKD